MHNPIPGTWTAVIFTVSNAPYFGPVQFSYFTQQFHPAGSVSPSSRTLSLDTVSGDELINIPCTYKVG